MAVEALSPYLEKSERIHESNCYRSVVPGHAFHMTADADAAAGLSLTKETRFNSGSGADCSSCRLHSPP